VKKFPGDVDKKRWNTFSLYPEEGRILLRDEVGDRRHLSLPSKLKTHLSLFYASDMPSWCGAWTKGQIYSSSYVKSLISGVYKIYYRVLLKGWCPDFYFP
jgi:hypothetical protein